MPRTLNELAAYYQKLLPHSIPTYYEIAPTLLGACDEASIRKGVPAYRDFMHHLYGHLTVNGGLYVPPKKTNNDADEHHSASSPTHQFIRSVAIILSNIGIHGVLNDTLDALIMGNIEAFTVGNRISSQKMTNKRKMQCLQLLTDCGLCINGVELGGKAPIPTSEPILITYPKNPHMLTGLKIMATAQHELGTRHRDEILQRSDYRALANKQPEALSVLKDLLLHLPLGVQAFMLDLHRDYMKHGFKCNTYYGSDTRFEYFCRSKELWRFNMTFNNGHNITIKATNTDKYPELVKQLPHWLQERIALGYGCGKKMGITTHCDSGCRGYCIPLDESVIEIGPVVRKWLEAEVACITKKSMAL